MKMMVWSDGHSFFAVAQAETVEKARKAMLLEMGDSGDGSCPERDAAREVILNTPPSYWVGTNAEFALTTSAELREQAHYNNTLCDSNQKLKQTIAQLEAELAELKSAVGPLIPPWFHESVPPSREIYSAFVSGGFVTRYTVDQAKRAQKAMEPHA